MRLRQRRGAAPVGQSTRGQGLPPLVCAFGYFHSNRHRIMVSRRNLRLRRVHGDGPFVSVPVFLVPTVEKTGGQTQKDRPLVYTTVEKTGGQTQKDRPLVYKQISNSLSTSNGGVSGGREEGYTLVVTNNAGYELPSTGGPGTRLFTIFGGTLILGAGVLLWRRRMHWHNALTQCG